MGITPACAGKSLFANISDNIAQDHPRVCGEKFGTDAVNVGKQGSPPRVRGKGSPPHNSGAGNGITPACAGKSARTFRRPPPSQDHPRVCGEKWLVDVSAGYGAGSPPRVRGKALGRGIRGLGNRITPACAGKRLKGSLYNAIPCPVNRPFSLTSHKGGQSGGSPTSPCAKFPFPD